MDFLAHQNAAGFGLYVGAALRRGAPTNGRASREHIAFTRWVWIDVDEAAAAEVVLDRLASPGISPTFSVVTGRQPAIRRQCWWRLSETLGWPEVGRLMERLIAATGADPAPKDPPRVMRLTGFVAWPKPDKPGRVAELVEFEDGSDTTYAASELEVAARPKAPESIASNSAFHAETDLHGIRVNTGANVETCEAEVAELLRHISPDLPYSDWLSVIMGLHHWNDGEAGLGLAEAWSARGAKYRPGEVAEKWQGFTAGNGHTLATVAKLSRDGGADLSEIARRHGQRPADSSFPQGTGVTRESKKTASGETCGGEATEDGVARLFAKLHGDTMRFDHDAGRWFRWSGSQWAEDRTGTAFAFCRVLARDAYGPLSERAQKSARRAAFASGVEKFARTDPGLAVTAEHWDSDPFLLGAPGATVDLRTGFARKPDPADGIMRQASVAPADTADCPLWRAFLDQTTGGDAELDRFLQQLCGYALTGSVAEHALFFVYGAGGNGKSVFLNIFAHLAGSYAATAAMDTCTASAHDRHPTDLAALRGARLVTASETEEGRAWAESRIKQMTGGDPITARFMRRDFFTYHPQFKLVIAGNHKPVLRTVDDAVRRRFHIIPFTRRPVSPDRELESKLRAEVSGILRWAIEGCLDWQRNGLSRPDAVARETDSYFAEQDLFGLWLEDTCTVDRNNSHLWEESARLYESWKAYAKAAGEDPGSSKQFGERLSRAGFERDLKRVGKPVRVRLGLMLKHPETHHDRWPECNL